MTDQQLVEQVNKILVRDFEIAPASLRPAARLREDLGLDSLDGVDMVVAAEREFGVRIDEEQARSVRTLQELYECISRSPRAPGATANPERQ
jgi:acyl carrier protein